MIETFQKKIILNADIGLDYNSLRSLSEQFDIIKINPAVYFRWGSEFVDYCIEENKQIMWDFKFHDISSSVINSIFELHNLYNVDMVTIHSLNGFRAMKEIVETVKKEINCKIIAVTVLTSLLSSDLSRLGIMSDTAYTTYNLSKLAYGAGCDGVVLNANYIPFIQQHCEDYDYDDHLFDIIKICPGIRHKKQDKDDQENTLTAEQAFNRGADYIVMGRSLTQGDVNDL